MHKTLWIFLLVAAGCHHEPKKLQLDCREPMAHIGELAKADAAPYALAKDMDPAAQVRFDKEHPEVKAQALAECEKTITLSWRECVMAARTSAEVGACH